MIWSENCGFCLLPRAWLLWDDIVFFKELVKPVIKNSVHLSQTAGYWYTSSNLQDYFCLLHILYICMIKSEHQRWGVVEVCKARSTSFLSGLRRASLPYFSIPSRVNLGQLLYCLVAALASLLILSLLLVYPKWPRFVWSGLVFGGGGIWGGCSNLSSNVVSNFSQWLLLAEFLKYLVIH